MIRIGIICPSEIAFRRFLPALSKANELFVFAGVAYANPEEWFGTDKQIPADAIVQQQDTERAKAQTFIDNYGGALFSSYHSIIESKDIDAIYIPLPPALHYRWAKMALENGKHVLVEKPSTTSLSETAQLIEIASRKGLALHENYMFVFHDQIDAISNKISAGEIGDIRLYRIGFGFPLRQKNDFRYNKKLGGGALLDAGGYCLKYASLLLGETTRIVSAQANYIEGFEVEMFGSASLVNSDGIVVQLAFGMDNDYKCDIEIWGSKGTITSNRILTAPAGFTPSCQIKHNQSIETLPLPSDDAFLKSILHFSKCISSEYERKNNYKKIKYQSSLVEQFKNMAKL